MQGGKLWGQQMWQRVAEEVQVTIKTCVFRIPLLCGKDLVLVAICKIQLSPLLFAGDCLQQKSSKSESVNLPSVEDLTWSTELFIPEPVVLLWFWTPILSQCLWEALQRHSGSRYNLEMWDWWKLGPSLHRHEMFELKGEVAGPRVHLEQQHTCASVWFSNKTFFCGSV